jgi:hypothetical protein
LNYRNINDQDLLLSHLILVLLDSVKQQVLFV